MATMNSDAGIGSAWDPPPHDLQARTASFFRQAHAVRQSIHPYRSGGSGDVFINFDDLAADPDRLEDIITQYCRKLEPIQASTSVDFLAFLDKGSSGFGGATVGAIILAATLSVQFNAPIVIVRSDKRPISAKVATLIDSGKKGYPLAGFVGVLITDHVSRGTELLDGVRAIHAVGGKVSHCIALTGFDDKIRWPEFEEEGVALTVVDCRSVEEWKIEAQAVAVG